MPFKQAFEKHFNRSMQQPEDESQAGPSSQRPQTPTDEPSIDMERPDLPPSPVYNEKDFEQEFEMAKKRDPAAPPRFSTIFPSSPPRKVETEPAPRVIYREALPERPLQTKPKRGVHLTLPVFILFAVILFFESTLLFAYTIIGLYNNVPAPVAALIPGSQQMAMVGGGMWRCDKDTGAAVNNNFYLGDEPRITAGLENAAAVPSQISVTASSTSSSSSSTTTTSSSSTTSASVPIVVVTATSMQTFSSGVVTVTASKTP